MKTNRRRFLKLSAAAAGGAAVSHLSGCASRKSNSGSSFVESDLTNWAGNYRYSTGRIYRAKSLEQVCGFVKQHRRFKVLGTRHCFNGIADSPDDFLVRDLAAVQRAQSRSALLMTLMLVAAAAVSLLVGGIGIMNLMLVSVSERRQEIGLRMAIGARRREIGLQFLIEAGLLALLGSGAGVMLALGAAVAFGAASAIGNPATSVAILAAVAAATLITLISALFPARKAARLDPADALAQD